LTCRRLDLRFFASLYWPGFGDGKFARGAQRPAVNNAALNARRGCK